MEDKEIKVLGARVHNLRNVNVNIPRNALTVITGISGSGKSSLAFDTIYAEGQRRYIETFSAYARNFLGNMQRPDVDKITGLSPVISIEQKTTNKNPRSTVGTTTEIYDFLRLLFARAGKAYSYHTGEEMVKYTEEMVIEMVMNEYKDRPILILAPLVQSRKGHYRELFESMIRRGYLYVRVDGEIMPLAQDMRVDRYKNHDIEVVVDKLVIDTTDADAVMERLKRSVTIAMKLGDGIIMIIDNDTRNAKYYSKRLMCPTTGMAYHDPAPNNFSFNSPQGMCPVCNGLGYVKEYHGTEEDMKKFMDDDSIEGKRWLEQFETRSVCPECHGHRLNKEALSYRIWDKNISEVAEMDIADLQQWLEKVPEHLDTQQGKIAEEILKEIRTRVNFLMEVGLEYLALNRQSAELSGGESQRIRLATQIGSQLVNVLYILDEPSIGLHQRDNIKLINSLRELRDIGNSVIVVEHDKEMMLSADYLVDVGPGAGVNGGNIIFAGHPSQLMEKNNANMSLTAQYLNGIKKIELSKYRRKGNGNMLTLSGCRGNNLKNVTLQIPLGTLTVVTGVSGSGKSTLINQTLYPILSQQCYRSLRKPLDYDDIEGLENIDKVIDVDQSPIGRIPRSNPATYTGVFTDIRNLFVALPEAKIRGYKPGRFSFNMNGGRCETCMGNGYRTIEMNFMPDVYVPCEACHGKRYNRETLEVRYRGKSIADVLDMTIDTACEFFDNIPHILHKIKTLKDVGLGYIKLGQPSTTISGGEAQRIKLATELAKRDTGKTVYILDEPTTGLHFEDIRVLAEVLQKLVDKGNTVIVIEHNMDVIKLADYIVDMGPDGGRGGGEIVFAGTPEEMVKKYDAGEIKSYTAEFLKEEIKNK
ncbi:MAG: excinuclease ABC subunit UvrA [Bacteroidaceae bacterium]|nr:excinuclease ABC subunit UvrA [Bacteroidaceae bacterium]